MGKMSLNQYPSASSMPAFLDSIHGNLGVQGPMDVDHSIRLYADLKALPLSCLAQISDVPFHCTDTTISNWAYADYATSPVAHPSLNGEHIDRVGVTGVYPNEFETIFRQTNDDDNRNIFTEGEMQITNTFMLKNLPCRCRQDEI